MVETSSRVAAGLCTGIGQGVVPFAITFGDSLVDVSARVSVLMSLVTEGQNGDPVASEWERGNGAFYQRYRAHVS
jgi:hypothetical protein